MFHCLFDQVYKDTSTFCESVKVFGFVVVSLSTPHTSLLQEAYETGLSFFKNVPFELKQQYKLLFNEVGNNKGLAGFNQPTPAKEVFRIRRGNLQPWPSVPERFRVVLTRTLELLENVALVCGDVLLQSVGLESEKIFEMILDYYKNTIRFDILSSSPFDLFYYYNSKDVLNVVNCHEHADPGLLTVVPCSPIAGLEILDHETQTWISVENELNLTPFRDLVVFPGRTLQILTNDHYIGTTHRVGKNNQPRLSLVYELRTKADLNLDTFLINLQQQ